MSTNRLCVLVLLALILSGIASRSTRIGGSQVVAKTKLLPLLRSPFRRSPLTRVGQAIRKRIGRLADGGLENPYLAASRPLTLGLKRARARSNRELVRNLYAEGIFTSLSVRRAMVAIDRGNYVPTKYWRERFWDCPVPIGYGQAIAAPHMHAHALKMLEDHLQPGMRALDVGSGSGYLSALMAHMVTRNRSNEGLVIGIDCVPELVQASRRNVCKGAEEKLLDENLFLVAGDGREGFTAQAPFDAIHVGAVATTVPTSLLEQLKPGGRMVIPICKDGGAITLYQVGKDTDGEITQTPYATLIRPVGRYHDIGA